MKDKVVKRLKDMNSEELRLNLASKKAVLRRNEFKKSGQVNFTLTVALAKDFNVEYKLTEEQYGLIKLERNIANDNQEVYVYVRLSKGINASAVDSEYYLLEIVAAQGITFHTLLTKLRVRQLTILVERGQWPQDLMINAYPESKDLAQELILTDIDTK